MDDGSSSSQSAAAAPAASRSSEQSYRSFSTHYPRITTSVPSTTSSGFKPRDFSEYEYPNIDFMQFGVRAGLAVNGFSTPEDRYEELERQWFVFQRRITNQLLYSMTCKGCRCPPDLGPYHKMSSECRRWWNTLLDWDFTSKEELMMPTSIWLAHMAPLLEMVETRYFYETLSKGCPVTDESDESDGPSSDDSSSKDSSSSASSLGDDEDFNDSSDSDGD